MSRNWAGEPSLLVAGQNGGFIDVVPGNGAGVCGVDSSSLELQSDSIQNALSEAQIRVVFSAHIINLKSCYRKVLILLE